MYRTESEISTTRFGFPLVFFFLSFFRYVSVFRTHKYMIESALKVKMFQTADCVYIIMRREIYENYSGSNLVK